jgi:hypothetical protein
MATIAGTYFTSWEYDISTESFQLGPIVVIGTDNSVTVDGVTMNEVLVSDIMVSWSNVGGNPSSAMLAFTFDSSLNAMTFGGDYWMSGDAPPSGTNFYGFNTQPQASLNNWANTYYSYELVDGNNDSLGNLVISGTTVTFAGQTINNPIYTGLYSNGTDTNELAWFTTDGNENNVAISFFSQGDYLNFNGDIWGAGENRPVGSASAVNNFFGTTESASDADAVNAEALAANVAQAAAAAVAVQVVIAAAKAAMAGGNNDDAEADDDNDADAGDEAEAGDEAAEGGDEAADVAEGVADVAVDAVEDVAEVLMVALAAILVVEPDTTPPDTNGHESKDASGLSAKQLMDLKNES